MYLARLSLSALFVGLATSSLVAQGILLELDGAEPRDAFATALENIGDLNADGVDDLLVSSSRKTDPTRPGMVQAISGRDGSVLFSTTSHIQTEQFGASLSSSGDVDGDGVAEIVVGSPQTGYGPNPGRALLLSGADGSVLWSYSAPSLEGQCGIAVDGGADVDGDQIQDVLVGGAGYDGAVRLLSGLDGSLVHERYGTFYDHLGHTVGFVGDLDRDGVVDYAAASPAETPFATLRFYSGRSGLPIRIITSSRGNWDDYASSLAVPGDLDLDGIPELAVATAGGFDPGQVQVLAGATGDVLHAFQGEEFESLSGPLQLAPDLDQDGFQDLLIPTLGRRRPLLISSRTGEVLHTTFFPTGLPSYGSAAVLDQDLDGVADFALGTPQWATGPDDQSTGKLEIINGRCGPVDRVAERCGPAWQARIHLDGRILDNETITLQIFGPPSMTGVTPGLLVLGSGQTSLPLGGSCVLSVQPAAARAVGLLLDPSRRFSSLDITEQIPPGLGPLSWYVQVVIDRPPFRSVTQALRIDLP